MQQVLIVDDESRLLESIEAGLEDYQDQFMVMTAPNGKVAQDILESSEIDLVVTDLRMPVMDGFELLAYISHAHPFMPAIVMTAYATAETEEKVNNSGIYKLLEKPIEFDRLAETILESLEQESREGSVAGFSLANFLQLLAMEQKTCLLNIKSEEMDGYIYLHGGEIYTAILGNLKGEEALFTLLASDNARIIFKKLPKKRITRMINKPLMSLLMEGMQYIDEQQHSASPPGSSKDVHQKKSSTAKSSGKNTAQIDQTTEATQESLQQSKKGDIDMGKVEESLGKLKDVDGFMGAGVFTPNGEMAAEVTSSNLKLAEIGSLANDVLLKAQKATDVMAVGRGNVVHVEAPKAHVFARCLNENADFSKTEAGKAHVHLVMLLAKDGNLAMGKIKLESVIQEVAAAFR
ncbi:MAG: response regulator [Desulfocapsaceae bacterium]|nr:response regulator [Desulfocapsaceae bacterium]